MASKRRVRKTECGNKVKFPSRQDAERARIRVGATLSNHEAYHCKWCNGYHIGRPSLKSRKDQFSTKGGNRAIPSMF